MKSLTLLAAVTILVSLLPAPIAAEEEFEPIPARLTDRAVVMNLPAGVRRVRLRVRTGEESWKVHTIAHLGGTEGYLKLRLPDGVAEEDCEITASWTDPFPYQFYEGTTKHEATDSNGDARMSPTSGPQAFESADSVAGEVAVEESDIWKWRGSTLYFFNQYRGLQVIDVSDPAAPARLASMRVNSYGEKMYLHPAADLVILLSYDSTTGNGKVSLVAHEAAHVLQEQASFPVPGYILESRLIGRVLYVVSRNSWQDTVTEADGTTHISWRSGLAVTKIDLGDPVHPVASPPLELTSGQYNYWGAQVQATPDALLVSTNAYDPARRQSMSTVHVIDISDPAAPPTVTRHLPVAGEVRNKFNMNLKGDLLTVVSQVWRGSPDRRRYASVETFDLASLAPRPLLDRIEFANNESITATRFVDDLLYVVTFLRIDPLFVISLANPARLRILSELEIPGFSTYLAPLGEDALISIGVENSQIAVSWFDVSDPTDTSLASRVFIGAEDGWSWTEANWDEKALGFFPDDGLLLVPYQGSVPGEGWISGVQLVELGEGTLTKRGSFRHEFHARRARVLGDAVVSISGRALRSLDITDRDHPRLLSELTLAWPADLVHRVDDILVQLERGPGYWWYGAPDSPARVHTSPVSDPDELLHTLELPGGRIAGSFRQGDCLFVAQAQMNSEETREGVIYTESFSTTVLDLGDPDRPVIVGRTAHESDRQSFRGGFGANFTGALLPDGSLVWYPSESGAFFAWDFALGDGLAVPAAADSIFPFYPSSGRVYTVDISEKTNPVALAAVDLSGNENEWPIGKPRLLGSTLYYGLQSNGQAERPDGTTRWFTRSSLGHLDLANPAAPVKNKLVSVPGNLEHVLATPAGGVVVFTSSHRYHAPDGTFRHEFRIQALAFDGLDAFLLDELVAREEGYGPYVFHGRSLVLGTNNYQDEKVSLDFTVHEWRNNGAFAEIRSATLPGSFYRLDAQDDLLIASGSDGLTFLDFVDPADPDPATVSFPETRFWYASEDIEIHERAQAHLPQGFYGVETLDFGGVFTDGEPLPAPGPGQSPQPEWQSISFALLTPTSSSGSLLLASLEPGESWAFDDFVVPLEYDAWTRQALGLAAADPVPSFFEDTDLDGRSNGWEYFTGSDPGDPYSVNDLRVQVEHTEEGDRFLTGYLSLNPHATPFLNLVPRVSFDLENWEDTPGMFASRVEPFLSGAAVRLNEPVENHEAAFLQVELNRITE